MAESFSTTRCFLRTLTFVAFLFSQSPMDEADTPSFVRRTKSKSLRGRESTSTKATNDDEGDDVTVAATLRLKQKTRAKPKARLSFGGDDEVSTLCDSLFTRSR